MKNQRINTTMQKVLSYAILAFLASGALCLPTDEEENNKSKPGYCYSDGIYIKEGETVPAPIGQCKKTKCISAENGQILSLTCPALTLRPECYATQKDLTEPYPGCCPRPLCDSSESESHSASSEELELL